MEEARSPAQQILALLDGYRVVQTLYVGAQLGIPDLLKDGAKSSDDLAAAAGTNARALLRLLRALVSLDVLEEIADRRFALRPMGTLLRSDAPGSMRAAVIFYGGRRHWTAWGGLLESVKSGTTVFGGNSTRSFSEMAARDPAGATIFNEAMVALTVPVNEAVVAAYDFAGIRTLMDVGGGYGALLTGILNANPQLRGILFDIPAVADAARARIAAAGLGRRCEVIGGDAFETVPTGADAYMLKSVIHDWNDEQSATLLRNCRAVMPPNGKLLLVERVIPGRIDTTPDTSTKLLSDLNMLLLTGGCERSEAEYCALLGTAGFALQRIVPTATPHSIIEARPV